MTLSLFTNDDYFTPFFERLQLNIVFSNSAYFPPEYPYKFVKVLKHQQLTEKDTITLHCELDDAAGEVTWTKNGEEIKPDKR